MAKYIICLECLCAADESFVGSDDFGDYTYYECDCCGAGYNVYHMSERETVDLALVQESLVTVWDLGRDRPIVIDDSNPYYRQYWN